MSIEFERFSGDIKKRGILSPRQLDETPEQLVHELSAHGWTEGENFRELADNFLNVLRNRNSHSEIKFPGACERYVRISRLFMRDAGYALHALFTADLAMRVASLPHHIDGAAANMNKVTERVIRDQKDAVEDRNILGRVLAGLEDVLRASGLGGYQVAPLFRRKAADLWVRCFAAGVDCWPEDCIRHKKHLTKKLSATDPMLEYIRDRVALWDRLNDENVGARMLLARGIFPATLPFRPPAPGLGLRRTDHGR